MTKKLSDEELIEELKERFSFNQKALNDLREMTDKLEVMNRKLQESESLKGHFLSNIRNEINNPLTSIMGLSHQCLCNSPQTERCASIARMIYLEAFNLDFQLQNIFVAAELEAGDVLPVFSKVDVDIIIDRVQEALNYQIEEKKLKVSIDLPKPLSFTTDARMLRLVMLNLLANATEYSEPDSTVELSANIENEELVLFLCDHGEGIDPQDHEKIFDRFKQLETGTTKSHRGHGLGLSIVRSLVELMGGQLQLDSEVGKGCRFTIRLPEPDEQTQDVAQEGNMFIFEDAEQF